ncbi:hypothetical protein NAF17_05165 [Mucilaginibacter sp. RB4R14]|uniref:hypothetical protein n=1 Tax=Mucilaginibacter aurantiaciroseus TaxID=2949308 RepID=UPI0020917B30|nr:hypothetical protein [Mucilaginibacter aurantiaciroseus]MCO5934921.1 hypothetical protein [Mucilaginibacter aurantiaciroseus]
MNILKPVRLSYLKTQATFLLKDLRSDSSKSKDAAEEFLNLPAFSERSTQSIIKNFDRIKLKDALLVIAQKNGFKSWVELKKFVTQEDCLYRSSKVGLIYAWFDDYKRAAVYHQQHSGYLLKFWNDFVVCGDEYIASLSLGGYPEYWKRIGFDWVKPSDLQAWHFLNEKATENYLNQEYLKKQT